MHVAVVGGGIFGQVIAWRVALRGQDVTVVEPVGPGHLASASGDRSRIVRALYDEPCFARAGHDSLNLWGDWSKELGVRLVEPVGVLYFDDASDAPRNAAFRAWLDRGIANVRALGDMAIELESAEVRRRYPAIDVTGLARVVLEPAGGFGRAALATKTIARASLATGRVRHVTGRVTRIDVASGAARAVVLGADAIAADVVIVAAGYDGAALVEPFTGSLPIRRIPHWTSYWDVPYPSGRDLAMDRLPCFADLGNDLYGFPDDGESGFKMAWHEPRREDSGAFDSAAAPSSEDLEALRRAAMRRFPALANASSRGTFACAYDATPDEMFQIGPVPSVERLFFVGGLSGHGFKHAPSIGESVAALATGASPMLDLSPYALRIA